MLAEQERRKRRYDGGWFSTEDYAYNRGCCGSFICRLSSGERIRATGTRTLHHGPIIWPLQHRLQLRIAEACRAGDHHRHHNRRRPRLRVARRLGLWSGRHSFVTNYRRYQALYGKVVTWLDGHGIEVAGLLAEHFNVGWLLRAAQKITGRINTTLSFWLIALVYVLLGLLEVDDTRRRIEALSNRTAARVLFNSVRQARSRISESICWSGRR